MTIIETVFTLVGTAVATMSAWACLMWWIYRRGVAAGTEKAARETTERSQATAKIEALERQLAETRAELASLTRAPAYRGSTGLRGRGRQRDVGHAVHGAPDEVLADRLHALTADPSAEGRKTGKLPNETAGGASGDEVPHVGPQAEQVFRAKPKAELEERAGRHVYLSYAQEDEVAAGEVARDLEQRGFAVQMDRADIAWGESWAAYLRSAVETASTFVLVVSRNSSSHVGDWEEAAAALDRRGIDVVAVAVPPAFIQNLAGRRVVDYAGPSAAERLADRIELGAAIDFDRLSGAQFEVLVTELLPRYGYGTLWTARQAAEDDSGYDLRVAHDSRGREEYLVQVKAYRPSGRISVNEIQRLALLVREHSARGILVTSGQLTSVAHQVLDRINGAGIQLQLLDGPALRQMLVANPDLVRRHLSTSNSGTASR